jgi:hypothetical protein
MEKDRPMTLILPLCGAAKKNEKTGLAPNKCGAQGNRRESERDERERRRTGGHFGFSGPVIC